MRIKAIIFILLLAIIATGFLLLSGNNVKNDVISSNSLILGSNFQKYQNSKYGFSLEYPKDYSVETFQESDGAETIVFGSNSNGFQIFITPFKENSLTKEQISKENLGLAIEGMQEVIIGIAAKQNIPAFIFWAEDPFIGRTREVWFVHNGNLYEVTAYAKEDELLSGIMSTWSFVNSL